jgi:NDP-sugar pyrophosphorylase family protein
MDAYILTGGEGSRVKELTDKYRCQKHQIPINGVPFINYMTDWLYSTGLITNIHYLDAPGVGTAGALKVSSRIDHFPFLMIYGDCFCKVDLWDAYRKMLKANADMVIMVKRVTEPDYGMIVDRKEGFILSDIPSTTYPYWERRGESYSRHHTSTDYLTNIGTYLIGQRAYEYTINQPWRRGTAPINPWIYYPGTLSMEHDLMEGDLFSVLKVDTCDVNDLYYYDVGTIDRVLETEERILTEGGQDPIDP